MKQLPGQQVQHAFREARADYAAAMPSRFRRQRVGIPAMGAAADYHYANEFRFVQMREYARAMDRDDAMIGTALDRAADNKVQGGFRLDPKTGDKGLDAELAGRWQEWAEDPARCDTSGEHEFTQIEWLVQRAESLDGDAFALPTEDGALQILESDRCRTPGNTSRNVVLGVELDGRRRRVSYFFTKQERLEPYQQVNRVGDFERRMAYDDEGNCQVFHVANPTRKTQTRGVTAFRAVFDIAGMWEDTNFALLVKEQISAAFGIFFEQTQQGYAINPQTGAREQESSPNMTFVNEGLSPGQKILLPFGVKASAYTPNISTSETRQHMRDLLQLIGVQLGLPLQVLLIDPSETNFSGWRGAMDQMKLIFGRQQKNLISEFHKPVYQWQVRRWLATPAAEGGLGPVARRMAEQGGAVFRHTWHPPTWPYVNPLQDATADALRLSTGQASLRMVHAESGRDFQQVARDNVADIEFWIGEAIEAAGRIKGRFGDAAKDVHWQHLYFRDLPKGDTLTAALQDAGSAGGTKPPAKGGVN
ncbi:MAG: hypothetical protein JWO31_2833 [Phycisphaerales bacterium]|nr:hypothetical protein [Phycisphaerales bacterium]